MVFQTNSRISATDSTWRIPVLILKWTSMEVIFTKQKDAIHKTHPNLVSVPYPSSLHFAANTTVPHFDDKIPRTHTHEFYWQRTIMVMRKFEPCCINSANLTRIKSICDWRAKYIPEKDATSKAKAVLLP